MVGYKEGGGSRGNVNTEVVKYAIEIRKYLGKGMELYAAFMDVKAYNKVDRRAMRGVHDLWGG